MRADVEREFQQERSAIDAMSTEQLRGRARALEAVDLMASVLAEELDVTRLAHSIIDLTTEFTTARFGALVVVGGEDGNQNLSMSVTSGISAADFAAMCAAPEGFLFDPVRCDATVVRIADLWADPRLTEIAGPRAMDSPLANVHSYLVASLATRTGKTLGGLFFAHSEPGRFTDEHERMLLGVARHAAAALENARLFETARAGELANARLAAIVQSSDDAIISKNLDGIVQSWNSGAEQMFGYSAEEMIGQPIATLVPPERPDEEPAILARLRRGERVDHFETIRRTKQGALINVSVTISPIRDIDGRIIGASKVARDITERARANTDRDQLLSAERAARAEAERHSRMKDEFLATLGHELRTPLNAVLGWATLLQRPKTTSEEFTHGLTVIERNARLQTQLIEDLLDMSRVISGKLRLAVQPVELSTVIHAALESVRPAAEAKSVRIVHVLDPFAGLVSGDPSRLQQVVWNLLSNAVKFTPKGGRVQVVLEQVDSHVEIKVSDTGEGIPPEFLPLVFDRFRQADASTTRRHGGLGLGLAIVKHLVELHGGTTRAQSAGLGMGSEFTVSLPLRAAHQQGKAEGSSNLHEPNAGLAEISLAGLKAVVVDDEEDARELVRMVLVDAGMTVSTAASAAEALNQVRSSPPDVLISDIGMPFEDGYTLLRQVRQLPRDLGGTVPAIALTAFARADDRRRALLSGFQMHVPKPVEGTELVAVVASVTGRV